MWAVIKQRLKKRQGLIGISMAFILSSTPFLLPREDMFFIIGTVFLAIGLFYMYWIAFHSPEDEVPPLEYSYRNSKVIWGLWHTGNWMLEEGLIEKYHSRIKRLLLLDPSTIGVENYMVDGISNEKTVKDHIMEVTKLAKSKKIEVRWYDKLQDNAVTLYDPKDNIEPNSDKAWCVMQEFKGNIPRELRPKWKLLNKGSQFKGVVENFKDIWDKHSREPQPKEYEGKSRMEES